MSHHIKIGRKGFGEYVTGVAGQLLDQQGAPVGSYSYRSGSEVRTHRRNPKTGVDENAISHAIQGHFNDGRTFKGLLNYLPGFIGNSDEGTIVISAAKAPRAASFKRNAPIMVWKNQDHYFTVLVSGYSGWHVFRGRYAMSSREAGDIAFKETGERLSAFNADPAWGQRMPISSLRKIDQDFFRAYAQAVHK